MFAETHTTSPAEQGTWHYWEVRNQSGAVSLSLLHSRADGLTTLGALSPQLAGSVAVTDGGHWVFDVIQLHEDREVPDQWACPRHHRCDAGAVIDQLARPIWERLRENGVNDRAVYAELRMLADRAFAERAA